MDSSSCEEHFYNVEFFFSSNYCIWFCLFFLKYFLRKSNKLQNYEKTMRHNQVSLINVWKSKYWCNGRVRLIQVIRINTVTIHRKSTGIHFEGKKSKRHNILLNEHSKFFGLNALMRSLEAFVAVAYVHSPFNHSLMEPCVYILKHHFKLMIDDSWKNWSISHSHIDFCFTDAVLFCIHEYQEIYILAAS